MKDLSAAIAIVVEDNPTTQLVLTRGLQRSGVGAVHSHTNAIRALTQIIGGETAVDLIFCDVRMPHMDGVEFFRSLAEIGYQGGLILVSGEDHRIIEMVTRLARVQQLNLLGCLQKPIRPKDVKSIIAEWASYVPAPQTVVHRPVSAEEIKHALLHRELVNFYQPQVDLTTGAVVGVESLIRWRRVGEGIVGPGRFIPVAESHGLIEEITRYVLVEALKQSRAWRQAGLDLSISVNLSMDDLAQLDFPEFLAFETERFEVAPPNIVLEVTERRLMLDPMAVLDVLARLRLKRFRLSIDDFGTGYSSLAQLRDIAFDELKVDIGFVHGAAGNAKMQAIVEGSRRIAQQLGMTVVAEGIEDRADWEFIRRAGCDLAQGFFIARPMPADELIPAIVEWRGRIPELLGGAVGLPG
jgi:EAL domain-containing protein (putative c-di-GMP-specific phosphodiesterase class I)